MSIVSYSTSLFWNLSKFTFISSLIAAPPCHIGYCSVVELAVNQWMTTSFSFRMQVLNGRLYFYDGGNRSMEVFDIARGVSSVQPFGAREFFRVRSMTLFSVSNYNSYEGN